MCWEDFLSTGRRGTILSDKSGHTDLTTSSALLGTPCSCDYVDLRIRKANEDGKTYAVGVMLN